MKKIVALLMTAVMTIGMATAAFAAPSPQPTTGTIVAGKNASGQDVDLSKVKTSDNYSTNDAPGVEKMLQYTWIMDIGRLSLKMETAFIIF